MADEFHTQQGETEPMRPADRMRQDERPERDYRDREDDRPYPRPGRYRNDGDCAGYYEPTQVSLKGCAQVVLALIVLVTLGVLVWDKFAGGQPTVPPAPVPTPAPVVDLRTYTEPIRAKLVADPAKAKRVEAIYAGFRDALAGPSGPRVTGTGVLEKILQAYLTDLDAKGGVQVGVEIDQAIGSYLGIVKSTDAKTGETGWEPRAFDDADRAKLIAIIGAVSQAGRDAQ